MRNFAPDPERGKLVLPLCVGLAVTVLTIPFTIRTASSTPAIGASAFPLRMPERRLDSVGVSFPSSGVVEQSSRGAEEPPMSLDEFVGLLQQRVPAPVAEHVAREFAKDKKLSNAWKLYQKTRGGKAPAKEFVDFITRIPQFRQLMSKFQGDAGFKQAFNEAGKAPEISAVLRGGMKNIAGGGAGAAASGGGAGAKAASASKDIDAIIREWERKAVSGVRLAGGGGGGAPRGVPARDMIPAGQGAQVAAGGLSTGGVGLGAKAGDRPGGAGAHETTPLSTGWKSAQVADKGRQQFLADRRFMTDLLKSLTDEERKKLERAMCANPAVGCDSPMETDIWGACWRTGLWNRCRSLCTSGVVEACAGASTGNSYAACRAGDVRQPKDCIAACFDNSPPYGCAQANVNPAEWDAACAAMALPDRSYCLNTQRWGADEFGNRNGEAPALAEGGVTAGGPDTASAGTGDVDCSELGNLRSSPACKAERTAAFNSNPCIINSSYPGCDGQPAIDPKKCTYQGPCPDGNTVDPCTGRCRGTGGRLPGGDTTPPGGVCPPGDPPSKPSFFDDVFRYAVGGAVTGGISGGVAGLAIGGVGAIPGAVVGAIGGAIGGAVVGGLHNIFGWP